MEQSNQQVMYDVDEYTTNPLIYSKKYKTIKNLEYTILTYNKNMVCMDDKETGKYRSVIFSKGKLVSFSPPKSIPNELFIRNRSYNTEDSLLHNKNKIPENVHTTETIEGTMINLFYDFPNETWEIATKNAVGGRYWYFRNNYNLTSDSCYTTCNMPGYNNPPRTFRDMFMEAIGEYDYTDLNHTKLVADLPKDCCYSFVLQHPENHIVNEIDHPRIFLVAAYHIHENTSRYLSLLYMMNLTIIRELCKNSIIYLPTTIKSSDKLLANKPGFKTFDEILCSQSQPVSPNTYEELEVHLNYCANYAHMMGITLIDTTTGERTTLENKQYNYKKELRGNHPNLQYQYLCLWRIQKIPEFLKHFPVYRDLFRNFEDQLDRFINNIQMVYYMYYIKKQRDIEYSKHIMYFVQRIHHELFIPSLKTPNRTIITRPVVRNWLIKELDPGALLSHINQPIIINGCA